MLTLPAGDGVLPNQWLAAAIHEGVIDAGEFTIPTGNVQPASLDLRLGEVGYRMRCSFLPDRVGVEEKLGDLVLEQLDLHRGGVVLEPGRPY
ncbi:MAG: dCTP deaminase, partial [Acidimicrobiaceae bacterium]|nr:dCTP deaminase [Acidimicrobiaceae bacterium]